MVTNISKTFDVSIMQYFNDKSSEIFSGGYQIKQSCRGNVMFEKLMLEMLFQCDQFDLNCELCCWNTPV